MNDLLFQLGEAELKQLLENVSQQTSKTTTVKVANTCSFKASMDR